MEKPAAPVAPATQPAATSITTALAPPAPGTEAALAPPAAANATTSSETATGTRARFGGGGARFKAWQTRRKTRPVYALHRTRWILRAIAFVLEFVSFFIIVGLTAQCAAQDGVYCSEAYELIFVGLPMLWNIAEFITLCINRKGIHPGAHIALDLIWFGFLTGSFSAFIVYATDIYSGDFYDCYRSDPLVTEADCRFAINRRNSRVASYSFSIAAGVIHFVLFVLACIAVHKWRMANREARYAAMQALYRQPVPGPISVAGNMDPNLGYIVTYPDGRQVLIPPTASQQQQQQQPPMPQHAGFYAPQQQQYTGRPTVAPAPQMSQAFPPPQQQPIQVTPVPIGSAISTSAPAAPPPQSQPQPRAAHLNTTIPSGSLASSSPRTTATTSHRDPFSGGSSSSTTASASAASAAAAAPHQRPDTAGDRDSLYAPGSAVEAPDEIQASAARPGEAVPLRN